MNIHTLKLYLANEKYNKLLRDLEICKNLNPWDSDIDEMWQKGVHGKSIRSIERANRMIAIGNALSATGTAITEISNATSGNTTTSAPSNNYHPSTTQHKVCSMCKGTGKNPARERAALYSYSSDTKSNSPCKICGDRSSHYHKTCPSCNGKGYTLGIAH